MTTIKELFYELDKWKEFTPTTMPENMARVHHLKEIKKEIVNRIDVEKYRKYILTIEE